MPGKAPDKGRNLDTTYAAGLIKDMTDRQDPRKLLTPHAARLKTAYVDRFYNNLGLNLSEELVLKRY
jgi:hypothetical protein